MIRVDTEGHKTKVMTKGKVEILIAEAACAITSVVGGAFDVCDDDPDMKAYMAGMLLDSISKCARIAIKQEYGIDPVMPVDEPKRKANPFTMGMDGKSFLQFSRDMKGAF